MEVDGVLSGDDVLDGRSGLLFASHFDKFGPDESKNTRFRTNFESSGCKAGLKIF